MAIAVRSTGGPFKWWPPHGHDIWYAGSFWTINKSTVRLSAHHIHFSCTYSQMSGNSLIALRCVSSKFRLFYFPFYSLFLLLIAILTHPQLFFYLYAVYYVTGYSSNTWPLPRPDNYAEPDEADSNKCSNQQLANSKYWLYVKRTIFKLILFLFYTTKHLNWNKSEVCNCYIV